MGLRYKFEQSGKEIKNSDKAEDDKPQLESDSGVELYADDGHIRNICFIQKNGEEQSFSYNDLLIAKLLPENGSIELRFPFANVEIRGSNLKSLFNEIRKQRIRILAAIDERYLAMNEKETAIVTELIVKTDKKDA